MKGPYKKIGFGEIPADAFGNACSVFYPCDANRAQEIPVMSGIEVLNHVKYLPYGLESISGHFYTQSKSAFFFRNYAFVNLDV